MANKLEEFGVELVVNDLTQEQLRNMVKNNKKMEKAVKLFKNLISLFEENELTIEIINSRLKKITTPIILERSKLILNIFYLINEKYKIILKNQDLISFGEMIKKGIENLPLYHNKYEYLIIDEFQDIFPLRMKLINELIVKNKIKKFYFVGDDWQSIYSFSSSRVELFTGLLNHFDTSVSYINNTYRNSQELIEVTSNFIMQDNIMIKKSLKSKKTFFNPIKIYDYNILETFPEITDQDKIIAEIIEKLYKENENYQFLILARTNISKQ